MLLRDTVRLSGGISWLPLQPQASVDLGYCYLEIEAEHVVGRQTMEHSRNGYCPLGALLLWQRI